MPSSAGPPSVPSPAGPLLSLMALVLALVVAAGSVLVAQAPAGAATIDRLAVTVVGDGTASGNVAVPVRVDTVDSLGALRSSTALPTVRDGAQRAFTLGADRDQQGALQQSSDHRFVVVGGYDAPPGPTALNATTSTDVPRVVARVDATGGVDTSTTLGGAFSVRHVRGVASVDGSSFWAGGHGGDSGAASGSVVHVGLGGSTPQAVISGSANLNNGRVPVIAGGQLYLSSDRSGFEGVNAVGTGLPQAAQPSDSLRNVAAGPAGSTVAHDYAFVGDALYVTFTEGAGAGLAKYTRDGDSWRHVATLPGAYWGVTGRVAGDRTVLYAVKGAAQGNELVAITDTGTAETLETTETVVRQAEPGHAFRGVAFAPGFTPGTDDVALPGAAPTVTWDPLTVQGSGGGLAAQLGADNPAATATVEVPGDGTPAIEVTASSDPDVAGTGDVRAVVEGTSLTVTVTPRAAGLTTLSLEVTDPDSGTSTTAFLRYGVLDLPDDADVAHFGMTDASAAVDLGDGYFAVSDDDSRPLRIYAPDAGYETSSFEFDEAPPIQPGQASDLEAAAVRGDEVIWIGSLGNTRSGNVRPDRDVALATRIVGEGADARLEYVGVGRGLRAALVAWDSADDHGRGADHYGFAAATQPGVPVSGVDTLNVEGAEFAPDGRTLWLGFRSPLVPPGTRDLALLVEVLNIDAVIADGATPRIGQPIELDLGGRAIREIRRADDGNYLIIAGSADDAGNFALFGWDGDPESAPVQAAGSLDGLGIGGSWEAISSVPSLSDGTRATLLQDVGTSDLYGTGTEAAELSPRELAAFSSSVVTLDFDGAFGGSDATLPPGETDGGGGSLLPIGAGDGVGQALPQLADAGAPAWLLPAMLVALVMVAAGAATTARRFGSHSG